METLRYVVLANGLLAIVSIAFYVLLRRETFFSANRLALWLGLLGAIVMPLVELPDWRPQPVRKVMQRTAQAIVPKVLPNATTNKPDVVITFPNGRTYSALLNQPTEPVWSWQHSLIALYFLGVLLLFIRLIVQVVSLMRLINRSTHEGYEHFTLVRNQRITSPFSFFSWVVLNPDQHESNELEQILRHERVHVRERHSLDMIGAELVCIIFWFNPAAYLFRHLLQQTLEFSADRAVLAEGVDSKSYQYNLVKVSLSAGQSTLLNHFSKSQLKSRIAMLNRQESSKISWIKYLVVCFGALTVATAVGRTTVHKPKQPVRSDATEMNNLGRQEEASASLGKPSYNDASSHHTNPQLILSDSSSNQITTEQTHFDISRYIEVRDKMLFWIITPLTTFDELTQLKAELTKYGYKFEIDEMKFDMLHKFLVRMDVTVASGEAEGKRTTDDVQENRPMRSFGGQISIAQPGILGVNEITNNGKYPTEALTAIAKSDEKAAQIILDQHRIDYLIAEGLHLTKDNWVTKKYTFNSKDWNKEVLRSETGLYVDELGHLNGALKDKATFLLNNQPVNLSDIQAITSSDLHSIITRDRFINDNGEPQRVVLIYTYR